MAMGVVTAACLHRRNHRMTRPPKYAPALTAVIQSGFPEGFRQCVARRRRDHRGAEIGSNPPAVRSCALPPLRRGLIRLIDSPQNRSASDGIRAEGVEEVVPDLRSLRRTPVGQV